MRVDFCLNLKNYPYSTKTEHISLEEQAEFNFIDLEEMVWKNPNLQSEFKVSGTYKQLLRDEQKGLEWEQYMTLSSPPATQTPFKDALSAKQPVTTETAYNEAMSRLLNLIDELGTLAINEQGIRSELGYMLSSAYNGFRQRAEENYDWLQLIKQALKSGDNTAEDIVFGVEKYFSFGALTPQEFINLFDYASDKFEGLPMQQIMQDLSTIKGWWDNNSTQSLSLDDGTKVGFTRKLDSNGNITQTTLFVSLPNGVEMKFNATNLDDENSQILFEMFKQRENLNANLGAKNLSETLKALDLSENVKTLNSNANLNFSEILKARSLFNENLKTLKLSENAYLQTKMNLINKTNSNTNSLLQGLLQGITNDKNALKI